MLPETYAAAPKLGSVAPDERCVLGLRLLDDARTRAAAAGLPPWEFALELPYLLATGLSATDLRWLCLRGWVEHARETTQPTSPCRTFERTVNLALGERECFVISPTGSSLLAPPDRPWTASRLVPRWDGRRRELRWCDHIVKRFRRPASNQMTILEAFEEEGWPPTIDDPLPGDFSIDPKQRLHDAIKCLNRRMLQPAIQFAGDGSGEGVRWATLGDCIDSDV